MNPQAEELNAAIQSTNPVVLSLLSERGKAIFFPKKGILGQTAEAKGKKINATIGIALEDDGSPVRLSAITDMITLDPKDAFPYAPSYGKPELRKKWKEMMAEKNPSLAGKAFSLPVVTSALTHGLSMAGYLFMDAGDKLILPDLYWGNYNLIFTNMYGVSMDTFPVFVNGGFNVGGLREKLQGKGKKIVLLNFPNNPTGYTVTEKEKDGIIRCLKEAAEAGARIVVIFDDAYFGLVFQQGICVTSLFADAADLHENILAIKIDGATKEDYVWGFRVGFITFAAKGISPGALEALEAKAAGAVRGSISNAPHLSQSLVLKAFESPAYKKEKKQKYDLLKERCAEVQRVLDSSKEYRKYFTALPFNSGYFMCVRLAPGIDAEKVRKALLDRYDTGIIATDNLIRVAFSAVPKDTIQTLFDNIYSACADVKKE